MIIKSIDISSKTLPDFFSQNKEKKERRKTHNCLKVETNKFLGKNSNNKEKLHNLIALPTTEYIKLKQMDVHFRAINPVMKGSKSKVSMHVFLLNWRKDCSQL